MTAFPIEHEYRVRSAADGEALFRALGWFGRASVQVRGLHTTDPKRFERIVAAIEPKRDHTISIEKGHLDFAALEELAHAPFWYLDVSSTPAAYRSWPNRHTWVYRHEGDDPKLETQDIAAALKEFRRLSDDALTGATITGLKDKTKPLLLEFLRAARATVHVSFHVDIASARELAELYVGDDFDWGSHPISLEFPEGRIHGLLITPNIGPRYQTRWLAQVTRALRRAKLL